MECDRKRITLPIRVWWGGKGCHKIWHTTLSMTKRVRLFPTISKGKWLPLLTTGREPAEYINLCILDTSRNHVSGRSRKHNHLRHLLRPGFLKQSWKKHYWNPSMLFPKNPFWGGRATLPDHDELESRRNRTRSNHDESDPPAYWTTDLRGTYQITMIWLSSPNYFTQLLSWLFRGQVAISENPEGTNGGVTSLWNLPPVRHRYLWYTLINVLKTTYENILPPSLLLGL